LRREKERSSVVQPHLALLLHWGLKTKENKGEKQKGLLLFSLTLTSSCVEGWKPKRIKERNRKVFYCLASPCPPPALGAENQRESRRETERSSAVQPHLALLLCWGLKTKENQGEKQKGLLLFSLTLLSSCVKDWKSKRIKKRNRKVLLLFYCWPPPVSRAENQRE
jgi:hypothetical protein